MTKPIDEPYTAEDLALAVDVCLGAPDVFAPHARDLLVKAAQGCRAKVAVDFLDDIRIFKKAIHNHRRLKRARDAGLRVIK